jgi:phage repressor protein C with HTH and peptisase S24 domain
LSFSQGTVAQIESGTALPSRNFLVRISERYRVNADWLLYGRGDMLHEPEPGFEGGPGTRRIEPPLYDRPMRGDFAADGEEYALVRRMDLSVSAGSGLVPVEGGERERLAFSQTWLLRNGISADLSVLVRVKGDSMAPGIPDGALALVHIADREVRREGIYAFNRGDLSYIKRLAPLEIGGDGRAKALVVISDNPAYGREVVAGEQVNASPHRASPSQATSPTIDNSPSANP